MTRFAFDESSWRDAPAAAVGPAALLPAIERFLEVLRTIRQRGEDVGKHSTIYETLVAGQTPFYEILFAPEYEFLGKDLRLELIRRIDQAVNWDVRDRVEHTAVTIAGRTFEAPSIAFAWTKAAVREAVACLPLEGSGRAGAVSVTVAGVEHLVYFVTTEAEYVAFFRSAIELENVDENGLEAIATSAFPQLDWADDVWDGLGRFSRPFRDLRSMLVRHLSVLNDQGAELFHSLLAIHPDEIGRRLSALGADASDENGRTKRNAACERDRTRLYKGRALPFWWHSKLQPNIDRVHFLYRPGADDTPGFIVIGIFIDHCRLLN